MSTLPEIRCALCRQEVALITPKRTVDGATYHAGCWDRKVRFVAEKIARDVEKMVRFGIQKPRGK